MEQEDSDPEDPKQSDLTISVFDDSVLFPSITSTDLQPENEDMKDNEILYKIAAMTKHLPEHDVPALSVIDLTKDSKDNFKIEEISPDQEEAFVFQGISVRSLKLIISILLCI